MTDFSKILDKAKELEAKMKESQEKIKSITVEGISGSNSVKVTLNGDGEMVKIDTVEWIEGEVEVINFDVEPLDIYYAGGVLVHNKGASTEP